jgi:hypothetical protein
VGEYLLIAPCPICGQSALTGHNGWFSCSSCETIVEQGRWFGIWLRERFYFRAVGPEYRNAEPDLAAHPFSKTELVELAGSCYSDSDLKAIAAGDLSSLRPPPSTVAQLIFPQSREICYLQINGLIRAEGPLLPDGVCQVDSPMNRRDLNELDKGNLFISDQRLVFPSSTHTNIRIDRKLTGLCAFADAVAIQRRGEDKATYFLGLESRNALLVIACLQGQLDHLR